MTYLLDVNALLALGYALHVHHDHAEAWIAQLQTGGIPSLATCAITELGFVRVASGAVAHSVDVATAKLELAQLKQSAVVSFKFLNDELAADRLPAWVTKSGQTTDGHLVALAGAHGAKLATFDADIADPAAFVIP
jgi:predicted nucleic acid-binding protein